MTIFQMVTIRASINIRKSIDKRARKYVNRTYVRVTDMCKPESQSSTHVCVLLLCQKGNKWIFIIHQTRKRVSLSGYNSGYHTKRVFEPSEKYCRACLTLFLFIHKRYVLLGEKKLNNFSIFKDWFIFIAP